MKKIFFLLFIFFSITAYTAPLFSIMENNKYGFINSGRAVVYQGDGHRGLPESAPFDRIIVSAAAPAVPEALLKQLRCGGRLVMPVGHRGATQEIVSLEKLLDGRCREERYPGFIFVPLVKGD